MVTDQQSELSNKNVTSITLFDACTSIDAGDKLLEHIMVLMLNTCARSH